MNASSKAVETELHLSRMDRLIISAHAAFEGIGIAGLISAAFWYTTAPVAPDGFKGPISTYTIAITTIISLFLAIPITSLAYKKIIRDMQHLYTQLSMERTRARGLTKELIYELLKLRSLKMNQQLVEDKIKSADSQCRKVFLWVSEHFHSLWQMHYRLDWNKPTQQLIKSAEQETNTLPLVELLRDKDLAANGVIKRSLLDHLDDHYPHQEDVSLMEAEQPVKKRLFSTLIYATASGVACAEVLLSIGWTVISILIGVHAMTPISNWTWAFFALASISAGILFGIGMGLSRHKQKGIELEHQQLQMKNQLMHELIDQFNLLYSQHSCDLKWLKLPTPPIEASIV